MCLRSKILFGIFHNKQFLKNQGIEARECAVQRAPGWDSYQLSSWKTLAPEPLNLPCDSVEHEVCTYLGSYALSSFFLVNIYTITFHPKSPPHSSNPFLFGFPENFYFKAYCLLLILSVSMCTQVPPETR